MPINVHIHRVRCSGQRTRCDCARVASAHKSGTYGTSPVYQQLCQILRDRIASGELEVGRPIPSLVTLQQQYGVARRGGLSRGGGLSRLAVLVDEGLVRIVPGKGAYVIARPRS